LQGSGAGDAWPLFQNVSNRVRLTLFQKGKIMFYIQYLLKVINNPNTPREQYLQAQRELDAIEAQQNYINQTAK
jgi:hypothetical protein